MHIFLTPLLLLIFQRKKKSQTTPPPPTKYLNQTIYKSSGVMESIPAVQLIDLIWFPESCIRHHCLWLLEQFLQPSRWYLRLSWQDLDIEPTRMVLKKNAPKNLVRQNIKQTRFSFQKQMGISVLWWYPRGRSAALNRLHPYSFISSLILANKGFPFLNFFLYFKYIISYLVIYYCL